MSGWLLALVIVAALVIGFWAGWEVALLGVRGLVKKGEIRRVP